MNLINWVDIILICVLVRGMFVAQKSGLVNELLKFFGVFFAAIISCHYYVRFGTFLTKKLMIKEPISETAAFCFISIIIIVIFYLICEAWLLILKIEAKSGINEWGSQVFSLLKGSLLNGLIVVALIIPGHKFISESAKYSMTGPFFKNAAVAVYRVFYKGFLGQFFPDEPLNNKLLRMADKPRPKEE
ncbi:MAG: CvpA family protein [Candidatus Omnitrophica bacterium]|nr:CvpA family protein [Candidatus Omnitrophota bacterium]